MELLFALLDGFPYTLASLSESIWFKIALLILVVIDISLKAPALWRSARMGMPGWFIALILINTIGIFPGIFLLVTRKRYRALCGGTGLHDACVR